jgi:hypothetical protein
MTTGERASRFVHGSYMINAGTKHLLERLLARQRRGQLRKDKTMNRLGLAAAIAASVAATGCATCRTSTDTIRIATAITTTVITTTDTTTGSARSSGRGRWRTRRRGSRRGSSGVNPVQARSPAQSSTFSAPCCEQYYRDAAAIVITSISTASRTTARRPLRNSQLIHS